MVMVIERALRTFISQTAIKAERTGKSSHGEEGKTCQNRTLGQQHVGRALFGIRVSGMRVSGMRVSEVGEI